MYGILNNNVNPDFEKRVQIRNCTHCIHDQFHLMLTIRQHNGKYVPQSTTVKYYNWSKSQTDPDRPTCYKMRELQLEKQNFKLNASQNQPAQSRRHHRPGENKQIQPFRVCAALKKIEASVAFCFLSFFGGRGVSLGDFLRNWLVFWNFRETNGRINVADISFCWEPVFWKPKVQTSRIAN